MTTDATDTTDTTDITIEPVEGECELYDFDSYRQCATGAELWLDCAARTLSCRCASRDRTGMPASVWHRLVLRWRLPALTADAANGLMEDLADAAARVCAGFDRAWDGHNFVGRFDEDAREAQDEICRAIERREPWDPRDVIEPWDAADWCRGVGDLDAQADDLALTADADAERIAEVAARIVESAAGDGYRVRDAVAHVECIVRHLRAQREETEETEGSE